MLAPKNLNTPIYIFDLDGTLALIEHRRHLVEREGKPKDFVPDWDAFFKACPQDTPNWPVIALFQQLYSVGCEVQIWSARSEAVRGETITWLYHHLGMQPHAVNKLLRMRAEGDFTPDDILKRKWLHLLTPQDRKRIGGVFDDRDKVVEMWRKEGLLCCQVARGAF